MLFSRGCGLYLRAPGFDKTISSRPVFASYIFQLYLSTQSSGRAAGGGGGGVEPFNSTMSSLRLALKRSSDESKSKSKSSSDSSSPRYGAQPAPKRAPLISLESLVKKKLLAHWNGPHNDVCEACEAGGTLLECSFCNVCFHNSYSCLGSSVMSKVRIPWNPRAFLLFQILLFLSPDLIPFSVLRHSCDTPPTLGGRGRGPRLGVPHLLAPRVHAGPARQAAAAHLDRGAPARLCRLRRPLGGGGAPQPLHGGHCRFFGRLGCRNCHFRRRGTRAHVEIQCSR